jgi:vacuolar-type H+-ATPase subunit H
MSAHGAGHGSGHPANDNLLHQIAAKEKELESLISTARTEAAALLAQARADAEVVIRHARDQVAALVREHEQKVAAETARVQAEAEAAAHKDVEVLRQNVGTRGDAAVQMVVERVVKGS